MLRKTLSITALMGLMGLFASQAWGTFIDPADIKNPYQVFSERDANITEDQFNEVITKAENVYAPIIAGQGGRLQMNRRWNDDTLNASASQFFGVWQVNMYGGLARHPEMTLDGFAMVLCHELGHHLAGFTFVNRGGFGGVWAANEGQSDYFAAHSCARELWVDEKEVNATFVDKLPEAVAATCDNAWDEENERNLCYRINVAGMSLARTLAALGKDPNEPKFDTPDANKVNQTNSKHPKAQCRLDTTYAASLCKNTFDMDVIPGKKMSNPFGAEAEKQSSQYTCMEISNYDMGLRPRCWFKPGV